MSNQRGLAPVFIVVGLLVFIAIIFFAINPSIFSRFTSKNLNTTYPSNKQVDNQPESILKSVFSKIEKTYDKEIPWENINKREAFKFFPKEINGVSMDTWIGTIADRNYNPITVFNLTESLTIPVKNAYDTAYSVPEALREKFKLTELEVAVPVAIKVYEFDRKLNGSELSLLKEGKNVTCKNEESKVEIISFVNPKLIMYGCSVNLTSEQKDKVKDQTFFDLFYEIYFIDRNLLVFISMESRYIDKPEDYLQDYLSKAFNSNDSLFISKDKVRSAEQGRKFDENMRKLLQKK